MARGSVLPSVMSHMFSKVPAPQIQRSSFDRSRGRKGTFQSGYLVPWYIEEILPGDTVSMTATFFARLTTPLNPIMDNLYLDSFWFFIPNRILWDNWERFQGSRDNPEDSIDYVVPYLTGEGEGYWTVDVFSLQDYMGLPTQPQYGPTGPFVSALPFRAYNLIWNEWFRDQNTQDSVEKYTDDGPDLVNDYGLLRRGKRHDYFTSCLPWPQKGDSVAIPLGTTAPVVGDGKAVGFMGSSTAFYLNVNDNAGFNGALGVTNAGGNKGDSPTGTAPNGDAYLGLHTDPENSHVYADLTLATAATINQLREAFATQQLLEIDARSGTRYTEILKGHFGVTVPDFRLQRPEYLGGSSKKIEVVAVPQTSEAGDTPQGNLAAFTAVQDRSGFTRSFDEHGVLMCLVNVRADITYQQGLHRMWTRRTRYDFYMPAFAHLGEQAVLNREIFMQGTANQAADEAVFGYQERWAEYRYGQSDVVGGFRSSYENSLDSWHLALRFTSLPVLDDGTFIPDNPPIERVSALGESLIAGQELLMDSYFKTRWARPMPVYSVPGLERL